MKEFNVKSNSFPLYKAFKEECEKIGWKYNHDFTPFKEEEMECCSCLYFRDRWSGNKYQGPHFAFSNSGDSKTFHLETQYGEALAFAKEQFNYKPKRWRAERYETYFVLDFEGDLNEVTEANDNIDEKCYNTGNYFQTEEEAKKAWIKVKELLLSLQKVS